MKYNVNFYIGVYLWDRVELLFIRFILVLID